MNNHFGAALMKFVAIAVVFWLVLNVGFDVLTFAQTLLLALVTTVLAYVGDITIMPKTSNIMATIGDVVAVFLIVWLLGMVFGAGGQNLVWGAIISAVIVGIVEYPYHIYLLKNVLHDNNARNPQANKG